MEAVKKKDVLNELKKESGENKLILGTRQTLKMAKANKIDKVYLSSTFPESIKTYNFKKVKVERLNINSLELGKYLGKSFPIAVVGVMKNENI